MHIFPPIDFKYTKLQQKKAENFYNYYFNQCFGSGRIRIIGQDPGPDPYQETLIWIRVPKKTCIQINQNYKNIYFF